MQIQISKKTKDALSLILGTLTVALTVALLIVSIANINANSARQIAVDGPTVETIETQPQQPIPTVEMTQEQEAQPTAPAVQEPQTGEDEQPNVSHEAKTGQAKIIFIPVLIIAVLLLGVGWYFLIRFILRRKENAELESDEDDEDQDDDIEYYELQDVDDNSYVDGYYYDSDSDPDNQHGQEDPEPDDVEGLDGTDYEDLAGSDEYNEDPDDGFEYYEEEPA